VTGIAPTEEIAKLEEMMSNVPGVDRSKLSIITKCDRTEEHDSSFLNFIHAGASEIEGDSIGHIGGDSIMTGSGGTGVPGLTSSVSALGYFSHPHVVEHVGNLPIPEDEAGNYNDALDEGRCVIAYECAATETAAIEAAMREAGIRKVKTFTN
jgi:hypothetical protein